MCSKRWSSATMKAARSIARMCPRCFSSAPGKTCARRLSERSRACMRPRRMKMCSRMFFHEACGSSVGRSNNRFLGLWQVRGHGARKEYRAIGMLDTVEACEDSLLLKPRLNAPELLVGDRWEPAIGLHDGAGEPVTVDEFPDASLRCVDEAMVLQSMVALDPTTVVRHCKHWVNCMNLHEGTWPIPRAIWEVWEDRVLQDHSRIVMFAHHFGLAHAAPSPRRTHTTSTPAIELPVEVLSSKNHFMLAIGEALCGPGGYAGSIPSGPLADFLLGVDVSELREVRLLGAVHNLPELSAQSWWHHVCACFQAQGIAVVFDDASSGS